MSPLRRSGARRTVALAVVLSLAAPALGHAAPGPLTNGYVANASVGSVAVDAQGRTYIGGLFDRVGPRYGHGVAFSGFSSTPAPGLPDVNGEIDAIVADGAGGWYIGGAFTQVGGVARSGLAHIRSDLSLDAGWNPGANATVRAMAPSGGSLYIGGDFTQVGGAAHNRVAKLDAATGAVDPAWLPTVSNASVNALAVLGSYVYIGTSGTVGGLLPGVGRVAAGGAGDFDGNWLPFLAGGRVNALAASGTTLYVGGSFLSSGGTAHVGLAKFDTTITGADPTVHAWNPQTNGGQPLGGVRSLVLAGGDLLVGGDFQGINGTPRLGLARIQTTGSGALTSWDPGSETFPDVRSLAVSGDDVVVAGWYYTLGGQPHGSLGKVSLSTGAADVSWNPNPGSVVDAAAFSGSTLLAGGAFVSAGPQNLVRNGVARLNADGTLDTGWDPNVDGSVTALKLSGSDLFLGGLFRHVGGTLQPNLAKVSTATGALDPTWRPTVDNMSYGVTSMVLSGDDLYIGGDFTAVNSIAANRFGLAKLSASGAGTLDATWNPSLAPGSLVRALALSGGSLFAGGYFNFVNQGGGFLRPGLAKFSAGGAGDVDPAWNPMVAGGSLVQALAVSGSDLFAGGGFTSVNGQGRAHLVKLSTTGDGTPDAQWTPAATPSNSNVYALAVDGTGLLVGGSFTAIAGQSRNGLARLATSGAGTPDAGLVPPAQTSPVFALAAPSAARLMVGGGFGALGGSSLGGIGIFDLTAPSAAVTVPAEGARYPQSASVAAAFSCDDPDGAANVASCVGPVANGALFDTATAGAKTFTVTATDAGGETAARTVNYMVDGSAPSIAVTAPGEGATYDRGQVVTPAFSCTDADGAGDVASCTAGAIDTSSAGPHTFKVTARDVAGNTSTNTVSYVVRAPTVSDTTAPAITGWRVRPTSFAVKQGAKVSYALSEAAKLKVTVLKPRKGKRPQTLGTLTVTGKAGANRFTFSGKVNGRALKPGAYRLSAVATDATGNRSKAALAAFTILRR